MFRDRLRAGLSHVGQALREPEAFTRRWHDEGEPYEWWVFAALALTAIVGTTTYGLTMGVLEGPGACFGALSPLRRRLASAGACLCLPSIS